MFAYGKLNDVQTLRDRRADDKDDVDDDFIEWQMVNAAPNLAVADVYITAPEANITSPEKVATLNFGDKTSTLETEAVPARRCHG